MFGSGNHKALTYLFTKSTASMEDAPIPVKLMVRLSSLSKCLETFLAVRYHTTELRTNTFQFGDKPSPNDPIGLKSNEISIKVALRVGLTKDWNAYFKPLQLGIEFPGILRQLNTVSTEV